MLTKTKKIECYINERFGGKVHAAYGCSMGGSFTGLLYDSVIIMILDAALGWIDRY